MGEYFSRYMTLREKCPNTGLSGPYSVLIQENTDQKKLFEHFSRSVS